MDSPAAGKHRLKIEKKLGQGAFGTVFKGTYDGVACAVKTVSEGQDEANSMALRMFLREAQVLKSCDHRAIIRYKALCRVNTDKQPTHEVKGDNPGGRYALVVEFAKDGALCQKVSRQMINPTSKVYSNAQALRWAADIASGLEYLHLRSPAIFHRDVKLSNMVVTKDEDGNSVAKLSDFGLHVVADITHDRLVRVSYRPASAGGEQQQQAGALTEQRVRELQQQLGADAAAAVTGPRLATCDKDSAWHPQSGSKAAAGVDAASAVGAGGKVQQQESHDCYSEMHESCGRRTSFIGDTSSLAPRIAVAAAALQQQQLAEMDNAAGNGQLDASDRRRSFLFRRSSHHPGDLCTGRVAPAAGATGAAADPSNRSSFYRDWDDSIDSSMCSMLTDGTWVSGATGPSAAGTWDDGSISVGDEAAVSDMETVFTMTGQTGSMMTMAPEVFLRQPYNEKADVFSFGVVLYELMSRCLLIFTELPTCTTDPAAPDRYAAKVADGYRPARPKKMSDGVWQLISACWQQEAILRPHMSEVVEVLQQLLQEEERTAAAGSRRVSLSLEPAGRRLSLSLAPASDSSAAIGAAAGAKQPLPSTQEEAGMANAPAAACATPVEAGCGCVIS